jgi:hypothetical protein
MTESHDGRLERIEKKIDDLSTAMISLARAEEKLLSIEKTNYASYERINRLSRKLDDVEKLAIENARTVSVITRIFWIAMTVAASSGIGMYFFNV